MKNVRRESPSGQSFIKLYQNCPRKFYLKYLQGLATKHTAMPLINGAAFHEGKATWYKTASLTKALSCVKREITSRKSEFFSDDVYEKVLLKCPILLEQWICEWGELDMKTYKPLEVEVEHKVSLPNGFFLTIRPDAVLQRKDNKKIYIHETKTTGFSVDLATKEVDYGDQATAYIWALKKVHPDWKIEGVIPDISYWAKTSTDPFKIRNERGALVRRSPEQLEEFGISTMNLLSDISQRAKAVANGTNPIAVFPRNTQWCYSFFNPCPFSAICRTDISPGEIPHGFKKDPWLEEHGVLNFPKIKEKLNARKLSKEEKRSVLIQAPGGPNTPTPPLSNRIRRKLFTLGLPSNHLLQQGMVPTSNPFRLRLNRLLRSGVLCRFSPARRQRYFVAIENGLCGKTSDPKRPKRDSSKRKQAERR